MTTALANKQGALAPLKTADPAAVIERYLAEESTNQIAQSLGVTRSGLNYWLLDVAEDQWRKAQVIRATKRKDEAEEEMDTASDPLTLARARERLRAAQWVLERVQRRIYGQDVPVSTAAVQVNINLRHKTDTVDAVVIEETKT